MDRDVGNGWAISINQDKYLAGILLSTLWVAKGLTPPASPLPVPLKPSLFVLRAA